MILENLKAQTSENHQRLEQNQLLSVISGSAISLNKYLRILHIFYSYFQPVESKINSFGVIQRYLPDYNSRRKARAIRADIDYLGVQILQEPLPWCDNLPAMDAPAQAMGCLYVLEGSTLGGRFIAKNLNKHLGLEAATGASFFNGYGTETGTKWKLFQQALVDFSNEFKQEQQIISAANETFEKLNSWVTKNEICC